MVPNYAELVRTQRVRWAAPDEPPGPPPVVMPLAAPPPPRPTAAQGAARAGVSRAGMCPRLLTAPCITRLVMALPAIGAEPAGGSCGRLWARRSAPTVPRLGFGSQVPATARSPGDSAPLTGQATGRGAALLPPAPTRYTRAPDDALSWLGQPQQPPLFRALLPRSGACGVLLRRDKSGRVLRLAGAGIRSPARCLLPCHDRSFGTGKEVTEGDDNDE